MEPVVERLPISEGNPFGMGVVQYPEAFGEPVFDMHYQLEMGVVLEGRITRYGTNGPRVCHPGDVWTCGMWEPHGFLVVQGPASCMVAVAWPPAVAGMWFPEASDAHWMGAFTRGGTVNAGEYPGALAIARGLAETHRHGNEHGRLAARLAFVSILAGHPGTWSSERMVGGEPLGEGIKPALEMVLAGRKAISTVEAARACGMSPSTFGRRFKEYMGTGFGAFALGHRVHGAIRGIREEGVTLRAAAKSWGFSSESHLHRNMVRVLGHGVSGLEKR